MKVDAETDIRAPAEDVYRLVMDPQRLGEWVSVHQRLEEGPDGELDKGSRMTQCLKVAGQRFRVRWVVVEDDRPKHVVWEGTGPMRTSAKVVYDFEARGDGVTHFSYVNEYVLPGGAAGKLAGRAVSRVATRELERSLERLKKLVER
jgi:carbon monoxide dehydrogenase subunit G